jgi:hypothetical protein
MRKPITIQEEALFNLVSIAKLHIGREEALVS